MREPRVYDDTAGSEANIARRRRELAERRFALLAPVPEEEDAMRNSGIRW